jgi:hypothetical protein
MNKFTLSVGLNAIKKHFLASIALFTVTMLVLTNFNILDNRYALKKVISPGTSNSIDKYKADILEKDGIKTIIGSKSIKLFLGVTGNGKVSKYRVGIKDEKSDFVTVTFKGDSVESVFNTANGLIEELQKIDRLEIKHSVDFISRLLSSKYEEINNISLINKSPIPSDDAIEFYASMQKKYDKFYNGDNINNINNINIDSIIALNQKDIQNQIKSIDLKLELNREIYMLEKIIKNDYKALSYLFPVARQDIEKYFPNPIVFFGISLLAVVFYNLIMLLLLHGRYSRKPIKELP